MKVERNDNFGELLVLLHLEEEDVAQDFSVKLPVHTGPIRHIIRFNYFKAREQSHRARVEHFDLVQDQV